MSGEVLDDLNRGASIPNRLVFVRFDNLQGQSLVSRVQAFIVSLHQT